MSKKITMFEVAVIGGGCSGICMGIKLKQAGIDNFRIFEKSSGISGTWYDNTYPGAACDVPSHLYSYSFELNPNWSQLFSPQAEIKEYFEKCVDKYEIREHVQLKTEIISAKFCEDQNLWDIKTAQGESFQTRFLVSAVGALTIPAIPEIEGLKDFAGSTFHSARWNHNYNFENKRIAIVGSAASAIQIIPEIAPKVKQLYIFQRTPNYIVPRYNRKHTEEEKKKFQASTWQMRKFRWYIYWFMERRFRAFQNKSKRSVKETEIAIKHIRKHIKDPELYDKLIPKYPIGCKRILLSDDYYQVLNEKHVELVAEGIDKFTKNEIITKNGQKYEIDAAVLATGFDVLNLLGNWNIHGLGGVSLNELWKDGAQAHRGITVSGFPNFFMLLGPNTGLGHNSIIFMIESQVNYIMQCIKKVGNHKYIDVKESAMINYNDYIQKELKKSVWANCTSWYQNKEGRIVALWPKGTVDYWFSTRKPKFREFTIVKK